MLVNGGCERAKWTSGDCGRIERAWVSVKKDPSGQAVPEWGIAMLGWQLPPDPVLSRIALSIIIALSDKEGAPNENGLIRALFEPLGSCQYTI